ncbi:MAG: RIP metalloprotease RseP [Lentisphaerota bacterium]
MIYIVAVVVILFGLTIFVHELGHFLVARWCGMVVDVFSIGFGPALFKKKHQGITYKIGCIPFGGYVALPQMEPGGGGKKDDNGEEEGRESRDLPSIAPWKKILVALAGATGNMILAVIISYIVFWGGKSFAPEEKGCILGFVETNSAAYASGLRMGDDIQALNDKPIASFDDFILAGALADQVELTIRSSSGEIRKVQVPTEDFMGNRVITGLIPLNYCYVLKVEPGSSAEAAGLMAGDKIVELAGHRLYSREHLIQLVDEYRDQTISGKIVRKGAILEVSFTPKYNEKVGRALIGVGFNTFDVKRPWAQIKSHSMLIFKLLRALVTPKEARNAAGSLGGPLAIFQMFWFYTQAGLLMALWFTGLLNVNLAILNLLPIPVLDGGHIMFSLYEAATRRPVSEKVVGVLVNTFACLLIAVFLLITYRDVARFGWFASKKQALQDAAAVSNAVPAEALPTSP